MLVKNATSFMEEFTVCKREYSLAKINHVLVTLDSAN